MTDEQFAAKAGETAQKPEEAAGGGWRKRLSGAGGAALLLWKFKTAILLILTKGKFILLGLTKMSTLLSMLASIGLYWSLHGWKFGLGLVLSIYIHEMGHVMALRSYGIPAGAPIFIPGFGAFIRLRQLNLDPIQDSRIGLAGPIYGFGAALFTLSAFGITGSPIWAGIAHIGAVINLFNLIPVWQLDGGRGMRSLSKMHRIMVLCTALVLWFITSESMLLLIVIGAAYRVFTEAPTDSDDVGLWQFLGLLVALASIAMLSSGVAGSRFR